MSTANDGIQTMDQAIQHKLGCKVLYPGVQQAEDVSTAIIQSATGSGPLDEVGTTGWSIFRMDAADEIVWPIDMKQLWDADLSRDFLIQIAWVNTAAADAGCVWKVFGKGFASGAALTTPSSAADGTITYAAQTAAGANAINYSTIRGLGVAGELLTDEMFGLAVELDALGAAAANEIGVHCVRLFYTREICDPYGVRRFT